MTPGETWQQKVRRLMDERGISAARLAKRAGLKERSLLQWLPRTPTGDPSHRPVNEVAVVAALAAALHAPKWWLEDPATSGAPPPSVPELDELLELVPAQHRRLVLAARDPAVAAWLLAALDLYESARQQGQRRA